LVWNEEFLTAAPKSQPVEFTLPAPQGDEQRIPAVGETMRFVRRAYRHNSDLGFDCRSIMRRTLRFGIALFLVQGKPIQAVINPSQNLLKSSQLPLLIQNDGVQRFEVVLQMHQQRLQSFD
jgi:hypothetical protein